MTTEEHVSALAGQQGHMLRLMYLQNETMKRLADAVAALYDMHDAHEIDPSMHGSTTDA